MNLFLTQALPKAGNLSWRSADRPERRRRRRRRHQNAEGQKLTVNIPNVEIARVRIASINILNKRNKSQHQFACF